MSLPKIGISAAPTTTTTGRSGSGIVKNPNKKYFIAIIYYITLSPMSFLPNLFVFSFSSTDTYTGQSSLVDTEQFCVSTMICNFLCRFARSVVRRCRGVADTPSEATTPVSNADSNKTSSDDSQWPRHPEKLI